MSDLIDRQGTIKEIKELAKLYPYRVKGDRESYSSYNEAWADCIDMVESAILNQPTVDVVNCIDCRFRDTYECMGRDAFYALADYDSCSWGRREENEG